MINFDDHTKENIKKHNSDWPQIPDDLYRILIIQGSGSGKTNSILNLINEEQYIDKIYLHTNDSYGAKHILINKRNSTSLKNFNDSKAFIEYLNGMDDIYTNFEEYSLNKNGKY